MKNRPLNDIKLIKMDYEPLVSVCVITYNSSAFVLETLESIKKQSYKNVELIVSDDCSTDNTIEICEEWIQHNKSRFVSVNLISTTSNMGVAGNCNNAYSNAHGEWIKGLAGDDKLFPDSILEYVRFVNTMPSCRVCFAKLAFWGSDEKMLEAIRRRYETNYYSCFLLSQRQQLEMILKKLFVPGPGLFMQKKLWLEVGGYDEKYPFCEEYPFTYNVLALGEKFFLVDKELVQYRISMQSLSHEKSDRISKRVFDDFYRYFKDVRRFNLIKSGYVFEALHQTISLYNVSISYKDRKYCGYIAKCLFIFSPKSYHIGVSRCFKKGKNILLNFFNRKM